MSGWIGVDLDGTLAEYGKFQGIQHIGKPIPAMVERVKRWRAEGREVRIFTARVWAEGRDSELELAKCRAAIMAWCRKHLGEELPITNIKDFGMVELWDDRAVQVEMNTGRILGRSTRGLE